ncbi:methyltransferase domain-containing protein [Pseudomonas sp. P867]|uniref:class I SAM-dependent methyltransferase n=1 Tax=Pseudomonas sp. P867 TaxID=2816050 RepID=UPI001CA6C827|nr:methyltransferase domain-containing protein [Pseudomonas sp. P867]MBY8968836.1 methyltransferase domain-containing protein [Pseudomonas sp. P867]
MTDKDTSHPNHFAQELPEIPKQSKGPYDHFLPQNDPDMTNTCFSCMGVLPGDLMLEVGQGNGAHVLQFFDAVPQIKYQGLELSWLMHHDSVKLNQELVSIGKTRFTVYNGGKFPFADQTFDKVMTVNTLDFISDLLVFLIEARRTLKDGGQFGMAFVSREFVRSSPDKNQSSRLHGVEEVKRMIARAGFFDLLEINVHENILISNKFVGATTRREFFVITATKSDAPSQCA